VPSRAATTYWGLVCVFGTALPLAASHGSQTGQAVPAPAAAAAARAYDPAWSVPLEGAAALDVVLDGTTIVVTGGAPAIEARAAADGKTLWTHDVAPTQPITIANGQVFVAAGNRLLALAQATGRENWNVPLAEHHTAPALHAAGLLIASGREIRLHAPADGAVLRRAELAGEAVTHLAVTDTAVFVALKDQTLVRIDLPALTVAWSKPLVSAATSITAANDRLYVAAATGGLDVYRQKDLHYEWTASMAVPLAGPPTVDAKQVYLALLDHSMRALDAEDGHQRWREPLGSRPRHAPVLTTAGACVGLTTGEVTCLPIASGRPAETVAVPVLPGGETARNPRLQAIAIAPDAGIIVRAMAEFEVRWLALVKRAAVKGASQTSDVAVAPAPAAASPSSTAAARRSTPASMR
jgi:outer membrane protein assembly factor BamB